MKTTNWALNVRPAETPQTRANPGRSISAQVEPRANFVENDRESL
jgi:hypothetical protein